MKKSLLFGFILFVVSAGLAFADGFKATTEPVVLPAGTDGSYGNEGTYVFFGDWPQSLKADDVTVSSNKEDVNGWECYNGSDGFYYVKAEAEPYDDYEFDNGEAIEEGEYYYFKLEPIKWRVLTDDYQDGKLLVAENVLLNSLYDSHFDRDNWEAIERTINGKTVYPNNYKYSTVRAYLNGLNGSNYDVEDFSGNGFINKAFTKEAIKSINTVTVDNSVKSTGYSENEYACENTSDKIFLLSHEEVTESSYGFDSDKYEYDTARRRKTTDYSRATGAYSSTSSSYKNNGWLWLRSPCSDYSYYARDVSNDGGAFTSGGVDYASGGVVPALSISF